MKGIKALIIFAILLTGISACASNKNENVDKDNNGIVNPFSDITDDNVTIMSEYGHAPYNFPDDYTYYYQGGILTIPYVFYGGRIDSEVGLYIFIDGVLQTYRVNAETEYEYTHVFKAESYSEEVYMLNILPSVGKVNDNLKLNFVCVDFPYLAETNASNIECQTMSTTITWQLSFLEDIPLTPVFHFEKNAKIKNISFATSNDDEPNGECFELAYIFENPNEGVNNTKGYLEFTMRTEVDGLYKTTILINNSPTIINDNSIFFEHEVKMNEKNIYQFSVDDAYLDTINLIYAISVNLNENSDTYQIDVYKTPSAILLCE